jgi:hypothetical protein
MAIGSSLFRRVKKVRKGCHNDPTTNDSMTLIVCHSNKYRQRLVAFIYFWFFKKRYDSRRKIGRSFGAFVEVEI